LTKYNSILAVGSLFFIAVIIISVYAVDAATNTTLINSSNNVADVNISDDNKNYEGLSVALNNDNAPIQLNVTNNEDRAVNSNNATVEINRGNEFVKWNSSEYGDNGFDTLRTLGGSNPLNFTEKINYVAIVDAIGQQEAQFGDIQHVTIYGIDDASVIEEYGYGDCWADSCWLYNKLSAAGVQVRIMGYEDGGIDDGYRHTWIEINIGSGWQTWDYKKYNSQHAGDNGYGTPFVLIGPGSAPADVMKTGY